MQNFPGFGATETVIVIFLGLALFGPYLPLWMHCAKAFPIDVDDEIDDVDDLGR